jgi:hypothetical protein
MTRLILAVEAGLDHDIVPVQVEMPYSGLTLVMSVFGRIREINRDSSLSVLG